MSSIELADIPSAQEYLDSTQATLNHAEMIRSKGFLRRIYQENYAFFRSQLKNAPSGAQIELGSGGGIIKESLPQVITSDVVLLPTTDLVFSALELPFCTNSLGAIMMINVLHHLQDPEQFFQEATRTLKPGGLILMVEPARTPFSHLIYSRFHHEPFDRGQQGWQLDPGGRMSSANDALPWIIFHRDRDEFEQKFPELQIAHLRNFMPFRYILSGGVSFRQLLPDWSYSAVKGFEAVLSPLNNLLGLFMQISLRKGYRESNPH